MKKAVPYDLGIRIKRICSKQNDYQTHRQELKRQLRVKGYIGEFIENQLQKVDRKDRKDLLSYKQKTKEQNSRVPLVMTFKKQLTNIHKIVQKHKTTLHKSTRMGQIFIQPPLVAYRRDTNICDILIMEN
jgi:hypothetical protein